MTIFYGQKLCNMVDESYQYTGNELELFSAAKNWKQYVARLIAPYIQGEVLEAGAGIGNNTLFFFNRFVKSWVLLEPDKQFCKVLETLLSANKLPPKCKVINGYTSDIKEKFDTVIYIDVIEHIEDDKKEIATAAALLKKGGKLIVLSPAHNYLMSSFDKAIGHYRRYSKKMILAVGNDELIPVKAIYVDSAGLLASLANKYIMHQQYPTKKQITFWDTWIIPVSKIIDRVSFHCFGKTIIAVWKKK